MGRQPLLFETKIGVDKMNIVRYIMSCRILIAVFAICFVCNITHAGTYGFSSAADLSCYVERNSGAVEQFWHCGAGAKGCNGVQEWNEDISRWYTHGGSFSYSANGGQGTYWCCNGTSTKAGQWVAGKKWIDESKTETIVENVTGGTCTWHKRYNVCGVEDPVKSEKPCTIATENCSDGYTSRDGRCVQLCKEGYAFKNENSSECVSCPETKNQGIRRSVCITCTANQLFDKDTLTCIDKTSRIVIPTLAHNKCWRCDTPSRLENCLRLVAQGENLEKYSDSDFEKCDFEPIKTTTSTARNMTDTPTSVYQNMSNGGNIVYSWGTIPFRAYCLGSSSRPSAKPTKSASSGDWCWCTTGFSANSYAMPQYGYRGASWCTNSTCTKECLSEIRDKPAFRKKLSE